jgi:hypothetical protein
LTLGVAPVISGGAELEPFDEIGALREKVRRWLGRERLLRWLRAVAPRLGEELCSLVDAPNCVGQAAPDGA